MPSPIITLTTDWGIQDFYVGALKGRILTLAPDSRIVDLSHNISGCNQVQAAFVLRNAWYRFPAGSIHLVSVGSSSDFPPSLIVIQHEGHFFLGPDDGVFSMVFETPSPLAFYVMNDKGEKVGVTSDMLAASAAYLARGGEASKMGAKLDTQIVLTMLNPTVDDDCIRGAVLYVDANGNLITNITKSLIQEAANGRDFEIILRKREYMVSEISENYHGVPTGKFLALFSESGFLEVAVRQGNAEELLGIHYWDIIRIEFK